MPLLGAFLFIVSSLLFDKDSSYVIFTWLYFMISLVMLSGMKVNEKKDTSVFLLWLECLVLTVICFLGI